MNRPRLLKIIRYTALVTASVLVTPVANAAPNKALAEYRSALANTDLLAVVKAAETSDAPNARAIARLARRALRNAEALMRKLPENYFSAAFHSMRGGQFGSVEGVWAPLRLTVAKGGIASHPEDADQSVLRISDLSTGQTIGLVYQPHAGANGSQSGQPLLRVFRQAYGPKVAQVRSQGASVPAFSLDVAVNLKTGRYQNAQRGPARRGIQR